MKRWEIRCSSWPRGNAKVKVTGVSRWNKDIVAALPLKCHWNGHSVSYPINYFWVWPATSWYKCSSLGKVGWPGMLVALFGLVVLTGPVVVLTGPVVVLTVLPPNMVGITVMFWKTKDRKPISILCSKLKKKAVTSSHALGRLSLTDAGLGHMTFFG